MKEDKIVKHSTGGWIFTIVFYNLYIWYVAVPTLPTALHWSVFECFLYLNLLGIGLTYTMDCIFHWYRMNK